MVLSFILSLSSSFNIFSFSCTAIRTILEEDLQSGVTRAINRIISGRDGVIPILAKNIETVLGADDDLDTSDVDAKLGTLQDEILRLASSKSDYDNLASEIHRLLRGR